MTTIIVNLLTDMAGDSEKTIGWTAETIPMSSSYPKRARVVHPSTCTQSAEELTAPYWSASPQTAAGGPKGMVGDTNGHAPTHEVIIHQDAFA